MAASVPFRAHVRVRGCAGPALAMGLEEGGDHRGREALGLEDSKGWGPSKQSMAPEPMNNSSKLCTGAGSFCVWYIWSGTAAHDGATNVRSWLCLLVNTAQSSFLLPARGTEGCFDSQRRQGSYCCLCMRVHTHAHKHPPPPPTPTNKKPTPPI